MNNNRILRFLLPLIILAGNNIQVSASWDDNNRDDIGGRTVSSEMRTFPRMSGSESLESRILPGDELQLHFSVDMEWLNYRRVGSSSLVQHTAFIRNIAYKYRVGYRLSATGPVTWFSSGYTSGNIWVERSDDDPGQSGNTYSYYVKTRNWEFSDTYTAPIGSLRFDTEYFLVVEFLAKPTDVYDKEKNRPSEQDGIFLQDNPHYFTWQTIEITKDAAGNNLTFSRKNFDTPNISFNELNTPKMLVGSRQTYVAYNHPEAELSVRLAKSGLKHKKEIGTDTYLPVSTLVKSTGTVNPIPQTFSYKVILPPNCASVECDGGKNSNNRIYYMYDRIEEREWYVSTGNFGNVSANNLPYIRFNGIVEFPKANGSGFDNAMISINHDGCVDSNGESLNGNPDYWYEWRLRLKQLDDNAGDVSIAGKQYSLQNANAYFTETTVASYIQEKYWRVLGYENPTSGARSYNMFSTSADETYYPKSNILQFEVLPQVCIPLPSVSERHPVERCVAVDTAVSAFRESDVIVLYAKTPDTGNYSPSLYGIEDFWEVSFDGINWQSMNDPNLAIYKLHPDDLSFTVIADADKDLIVKSTILKGRENVYFRQACILNSFSSDQQSSLYNYHKDGRWYIKVVSAGCYTYMPVRNVGLDVYAKYSDGSEDEYAEEKICKGEEFITKSLRWSLTSTSQNAEYVIYELVDGEEIEIQYGFDEYELPEIDSTKTYRLAAEFCNERVFRDVKFIVNELPIIDVKKITSNQIIIDADSISRKLRILSRGGEILLSMDDTSVNCDYYYRKVVPYVAPEVAVTDFSTYDNAKCVEFILSKGWDYKGETGNDFDEVSTAQLRNYCTMKQQAENDAAVQAAIHENVKANSWQPVIDSRALELDQSGTLYFLRKRVQGSPCLSDSVMVEIDAVRTIIGNSIAFTDTEYIGKDTVYVDSGSTIPSVTSFTVSGGYGKPVSNGVFSYVYQWIYRYAGDVWQDLKRYTDNGRSSVSQTQVSLLDYDSKLLDRDMEIARVVISRINGDETTQYCDTSNVLYLATETYLDAEKVRIINDGACAGSVIDINLNDEFDTEEYRLVYFSDDARVEIVPDESEPSLLHLLGIRENFNVYVKRENLKTGACSNQISIPVSVTPAHASFVMIVDGVEARILDDSEEYFYVRPGTLVQFKDESEGDILAYDWSLQVQNWLDDDIEGDKSSQRDPYCYLYNQGDNIVKLSIRAKRPDGGYCSSEVTAENIYVQGTPVTRSVPVGSAFVENERVVEEFVKNQSEWIEVYPTMLAGDERTVHLRSNTDYVEYYLFDESGRLVMDGNFDGMGDLQIPAGKSARYVLMVNGRSFKILNR